jgi:hypothetical protein
VTPGVSRSISRRKAIDTGPHIFRGGREPCRCPNRAQIRPVNSVNSSSDKPTSVAAPRQVGRDESLTCIRRVTNAGYREQTPCRQPRPGDAIGATNREARDRLIGVIGKL